jgi:hypothetical protein
MTKREAERYAYLSRAMETLGISREDFAQLLRIEKTLRRWAERECNEDIEYDEASGKTFVTWHTYGSGTAIKHRIANRERGALKRLGAIMARYPKLAAYHQSDPRGCALYVYERSALYDNGPKRDIDSCYSSVGVAVCY